jgi:hypothetical protein
MEEVASQHSLKTLLEHAPKALFKAALCQKKSSLGSQHSIKHYNSRNPMSPQSRATSTISSLHTIRQRCRAHTDNLYHFIETYRTSGFVDVPKITEAHCGITSVAGILQNKVSFEWVERCCIDLMWRIGERCVRILTCWEFGVLDPELSELEALLGLFCRGATLEVAKGDESLMVHSNATFP